MKYLKNILLSLIASCAVVFSGSVFAAETPAKLTGAEVVDAAKASSLMAAGAKMIDTRVANEFAEAHIKGAINVPYKEKSAKAADFDASADSFDVSKLPSDKAVPIITQCNGAECWKSYKGAVAAIKAGHKKVYWFRGGFPEWKSKGLPVE
jgi:rhodanese-related sulfurtransferase